MRASGSVIPARTSSCASSEHQSACMSACISLWHSRQALLCRRHIFVLGTIFANAVSILLAFIAAIMSTHCAMRILSHQVGFIRACACSLGALTLSALMKSWICTCASGKSDPTVHLLRWVAAKVLPVSRLGVWWLHLPRPVQYKLAVSHLLTPVSTDAGYCMICHEVYILVYAALKKKTRVPILY